MLKSDILTGKHNLNWLGNLNKIQSVNTIINEYSVITDYLFKSDLITSVLEAAACDADWLSSVTVEVTC